MQRVNKYSPPHTLRPYTQDMSSTTEIASAFIQGAPPGELQEVSKLKPAFQKYNEEQLTSTKLTSDSQVNYTIQPCTIDERYDLTEWIGLDK